MHDWSASTATSTTAVVHGRSLVTFCGCNYLALAQHPRVLDAARRSLALHGLSTSASRSTSGDTTDHRALEDELAELTGRESALLLPEGFTANIAACQTLRAGGVRTALVDARGHQSLRDAAATAGMALTSYAHLDPDAAAARLRAIETPAVVLTDGVFTADGARAPLPDLLAALRPDDTLLVDDCHGFAVLGPHGGGSLAETRLNDPRLVMTTTLAKGLGCAGGAVLASDPFVRAARSTASAFICTTPTAPPLVAAAREAVRVLRAEPQRFDGLRRNVARVRDVLVELGLEAHRQPVPIFAFTIDPAERMPEVRAALLERGVEVPLMSYPGGPAPTYFRLSVNADHTPEQIALLQAALTHALDRACVAANHPPRCP